jgi:CRP-like cAMP-binding protein
VELLIKNIERKVLLSKEDKKLLAENFHPKKFKRRQFILESGEISKHLYFVTKGCLRGYYIDKDGFEHVVNFAIEDWWIGDFGFNTGEAAILTIDTLEDSEVLYIDKPSMDKLYDEIPQLDRYFRILLQNALMAQFQRIMHINSFNAEDRYSAFLKKYPQFVKRIPQKYLASYLGITPEFLSKLKKQMLKMPVREKVAKF